MVHGPNDRCLLTERLLLSRSALATINGFVPIASYLGNTADLPVPNGRLKHLGRL